MDEIRTTEFKTKGFVAPVTDGKVSFDIETYWDGDMQVALRWESAPRDGMGGRVEGDELSYYFADVNELRTLRKALTAAIRHLEDAEDE